MLCRYIREVRSVDLGTLVIGGYLGKLGWDEEIGGWGVDKNVQGTGHMPYMSVYISNVYADLYQLYDLI